MLMQLRDAGKLRLDAPVQPYLPEVQLPRRHAGAPEITFRHLVTHTAGLTKEAPAEYWATGEFPPIEYRSAARAVCTGNSHRRHRHSTCRQQPPTAVGKLPRDNAADEESRRGSPCACRSGDDQSRRDRHIQQETLPTRSMRYLRNRRSRPRRIPLRSLGPRPRDDVRHPAVAGG
ncbi:MAG: serine hydrolase [Chloroflexi bacterium]|nr:serine hydrolase [Chloroflexota bacterium]